VIYGPWKDPASLGWPATVTFPDGARLATYFGTRVHAGVALGALALVAAHFVLERGRIGRELALLREGPLLARRAGLSFARTAVGLMAAGGAAAGIAGIIEVSVIEGRLQAGIATGAGYAGFLVAFLARGNLLAVLPLGVAVAGLGAAGDNLQLTLDLPSSIVHVLEGLLFASALVARGGARSRGVEAPS
jgi:general nucleoside transport system permease protein